MARLSHSIPSVALVLWVVLTHFCSGVRVELGATVGESVTFTCTVNVSGSVSWQWSKDGVVLTQSDSRIVGVGTANLTILSVEESDFGNYSCSPNPADNQRQDFILSVSPAMVVLVLPSSVILVNRTGLIDLECVAGGGPENTFQWYHDNQLLPGETHSVLELTDIGISGGGYFNCTVTNAAGTGSNTTLVVVSGTLVFVNEPENLTVTVEDSTSLHCDVAGSTPVTYQWYRNAEVLTDSNDHITGSTTAMLSFDPVDPTDSGSYSCNASSGSLTVSSRQAILTVLTIRLFANGEGKLPQGQIEGRVEVYHNGVWGTVCDDHWDMNDARVVCRQLGYDFVLEAPVEAEYGAGTDQIWLDEVGCSGNESDIADCNHNGWGVVGLCDHSEDAGVKCSDTAPNVTLRLVGGSDSSRGRLEVYHDGRWGTVCDDDWDIEDGQVACLQMGFGAAVEVILKGGSRRLRGRDPIWLDNVECTGLEDNIVDCEHNGWGVTDCTHFEDAGLVCLDNVLDIPVRLVGGSVSTEGRVEVFYRGEWGTICDDNWDINEAQVVCRQLGYDTAFAAYSNAKFGEGSGTIWMDELQCNGNEQNILEDCRFNGWGRNDCDHSEDAGVLCLVLPEMLVTVTPPIMVLANQSDSVTLSCSSEGGPGNTFQWSHDGTDLQGETDPILQLSNLTATDGGRYTCSVTNPASKGRNSTNVIVSIILVKGPVDRRATVGDVVRFNCTVAGSQLITYKWYHNGEALMDEGHIIDSNTSSLTLTSLQLEDYGNYSCTADNPVNMVASDTAELTGQCDVINVTPQIINEVGGTTLNITLSELCLLSESDMITCTFDGISVTATYLNPKIAQCVVPSVGTVGNVTLTISGVTATNGFFYHQMKLINITSAVVECVPPCQNGTCLGRNLCSCETGYSGPTCEEKAADPPPDSPSVDTVTNIYQLSGVIGGCGLLLLLLAILFVAVSCCHRYYCTQKNTLLLNVHSEEQIKKSLSAKSGSRDDYEYVSIAGGDETVKQAVPPGQPGLLVQQVLSRPPDQPVPPVPSGPPVQPVSLLPSGPPAPVAEENAYESIDYDSTSEEMKTAD